MKELKYILLALILFPFAGIVSSCSDDNSEDEDEYANWQTRNDAVVSQWSSDASLRKIKCFTKDQTTGGTSNDYIYVEVLEEGSETESPLFTDSVWVAYRGRLIPTTQHPEGYVFDQSYSDDFSWRTADMSQFCVNALVSGFSTALMQMHRGDRWRVRIPYHLGYGSSSKTYIPGYSNLIFDIALLDFWHPGETRPEFKARQE